jgi:alanine dehydrogenase
MFVLSEADVAAVLPMRDVIAAVDTALRAQAAGKVHQPQRVAVRTAPGMFGSMPCAIEGMGLGAKLVTFFPGNAKHALHTHHAVIALFDPETGVPIALIDGRLITELRTAATSAIATRALALESADVVAILGSGVQSRSHVDALFEIGMIRELRVWGRTPARAQAIVAWASERGIRAVPSPTVSEATHGAQIICTLTPAQAPILESYDVDPGTHVNAVGSSAPHMQELATALVGRSRLFVDTIEGAMNEAGDIIEAIREGALPPQPAMVRLCDVVAGAKPGRTVRDEVTIFKSLGMAIEDIACATLAYDRAKARGLGTSVLL